MEIAEYRDQFQFSAIGDRVMGEIRELAKYGSVGQDAVTRLAFTDEDVAAREYVMLRMKNAGLDVSIDTFGNIFGKREGRRTSPSVMVGSHIDGPPMGGMYDGNIGVLGGIECARMFNELDLETEYPIEVVVLAAEHLDRFGLGCLGSRALAGKLKQSDLVSLTDQDNVTLWDALENCGLDPAGLATAERSKDDILAYLELHIEQGPVLEKQGQKIGVVTAISGPTRIEAKVVGETNHSGGTPMRMRRDALAAAAEIVLSVETCAQQEQDYGTVGTVGVVWVEPGSMVAIPGRANLLIDIRGVDWESKRRTVRCFEEHVSRIRQSRHVEIETITSVDEKPVPCSPQIVQTVDSVAKGMSVESYRMPSGGGHDAQHIAAITDAGMIFVPSTGGISHAPEEHTDIDDICTGISVLAGSVWSLANP